jgi:dihydrofolate synthase/folylpolyglutamate synthase
MTLFTNAADVHRYLDNFINLERGQSKLPYRLDRMELLAAAAGNPERCAPVLHVTGSKGKGSVTWMSASILSAAGLRPAVFSSPHVSDFRERICTVTGFFDDSVYAAAGEEVRAAATSVIRDADLASDLSDPRVGTGGELTFFELFTLWFFLCARRDGSGAMAVEVGMGGRVDCTNIVDPVAAAITQIELEHTEYLGTTIAAIAGEKAGIIKPGKPVIVAEQPPDALEVFRRVAAEVGSPLLYVPDHATISDLRITRDSTTFTLDIPGVCTLSDIEITIPGAVQARNAAQAVLLVKTAFPQIDEATIRLGLKKFSLQGRFERIADRFVIDGAHTDKSTKECAQTFAALYGEGGVLLFGCALHKDVRAMANNLAPKFAHIIITTPGTFKMSNTQEIYEVFLDVVQGAAEVELVPDTAAAVAKAVQIGEEKGLPILGTGSFYLAAEIRQRVLKATSEVPLVV